MEGLSTPFANAGGPEALMAGLDSVMERLSDARKAFGRDVE